MAWDENSWAEQLQRQTSGMPANQAVANCTKLTRIQARLSSQSLRTKTKLTQAHRMSSVCFSMRRFCLPCMLRL